MKQNSKHIYRIYYEWRRCEISAERCKTFRKSQPWGKNCRRNWYTIGTPIEKAIAALPNKAKVIVYSAAEKAIHQALKLSLKTLDNFDPKSNIEAPESLDGWHKLATATTGAIGGAFGIMALTIELPISTTIMMRSISDVAWIEGADIQDLQTQLECVQALALGGTSDKDNDAEIGYFVTREAMTKAVSEALIIVLKMQCCLGISCCL